MLLLWVFLLSATLGFLGGIQTHTDITWLLVAGLGISGVLAAVGHTVVELRLLGRWLMIDHYGGYQEGGSRAWLDATVAIPSGFILAAAMGSLWPTRADVLGSIDAILVAIVPFFAGLVVAKFTLWPLIEHSRSRHLIPKH